MEDLYQIINNIRNIGIVLETRTKSYLVGRRSLTEIRLFFNPQKERPARLCPPNRFGCTSGLKCAVSPVPRPLWGFHIKEWTADLNVKHSPGQTFRIKVLAKGY
jgi:hypothetical protein